MDSKTTVRYTVQYCVNGYDITHEVFAEQTADEIRAWDGNEVVVVLRRTPNRQWRIAGGNGRFPDDMYEAPYTTLESVLADLAEEWSVEFVREG